MTQIQQKINTYIIIKIMHKPQQFIKKKMEEKIIFYLIKQFI